MIRLLSVDAGRRLLQEATDAAVIVDLDDTERRRIGDRSQVNRRLGAGASVFGDKGGDVEVADHVAVERQERAIDPGELGSEADRSGGVERLRLDGVAQLDRAASPVGKGGAEGVREEPEGQRDRGDVATFEAADEAGDDRLVADRQHRLGHLSVSGLSRVPKPPTRTMACTVP